MAMHQALLILFSVLQYCLIFAVFMINVIGLGLTTGSAKLELLPGVKKTLDSRVKPLTSFTELEKDDPIEGTTFGSLKFSEYFCDCIGIDVTEYPQYSDKVSKVDWYVGCQFLSQYGCKEIRSEKPFEYYRVFNGKKYSFTVGNISYWDILSNSVKSGEQCPKGKKACGIINDDSDIYCDKSCPLQKIEINGKEYGDENHMIFGIGLNIPNNTKIEYSVQSEGKFIGYNITKRQIVNENNMDYYLDKMWLDSSTQYPNEKLNSTYVNFVLNTNLPGENGISLECFDSVKKIYSMMGNYNHILYHGGYNGCVFGFAVAWVALGFFFYPIIFSMLEEKIVGIVLFSILEVLTLINFITTSMYLAETHNSKYDFDDVCDLFSSTGPGRLNTVQNLLTIDEVFLILTLIFGGIAIYCLVYMYCYEEIGRTAKLVGDNTKAAIADAFNYTPATTAYVQPVQPQPVLMPAQSIVQPMYPPPQYQGNMGYGGYY